MQKSIYLFFALSLVAFSLEGKEIDTTFFRAQERMLIEQHSKIAKAKGNVKKELELSFRDSVLKVIQYDEATNFEFDSVKIFGRIVSSDDKLIVYTWNIPQAGGFHNYYCIIQYYQKKLKKHTAVVLNEQAGFLNKNQQGIASPNNWPGALYYEIIPSKYKGVTTYTLFGFDFNSIVSNRKVIEVLSFDDSGNLQFKPQAFIYEGKKLNRIVFEYNEQVQMSLNYQHETQTIIFDHLSPMKPSLQDQYQFYGPDLSYDGFVFEDGIWVHQSDI